MFRTSVAILVGVCEPRFVDSRSLDGLPVGIYWRELAKNWCGGRHDGQLRWIKEMTAC